MTVGTKSVLFGYHALWLHGWMVAMAWWKLYGFPLDPRLWFAFFLHDIGYIGKPNMDGYEGKQHPKLGAMLMLNLFDWWYCKELSFIEADALKPGDRLETLGVFGPSSRRLWSVLRPDDKWWRFTRYHSRSLAKQDGVGFSQLCVADKLAITFYPTWFFILLTTLSGELKEYVATDKAKYGRDTVTGYVNALKVRTKEWVAKNRDAYDR